MGMPIRAAASGCVSERCRRLRADRMAAAGSMATVGPHSADWVDAATFARQAALAGRRVRLARGAVSAAVVGPRSEIY